MNCTTALRMAIAATLAFEAACSSDGGSASPPWGISGDAGGRAPGSADGASPSSPDSSGAPSGGGQDGGAPPASEGGTLPPPGNSCPPSWTTTPMCGGGSVPPGPPPDFGSHVLVFDPSMTDIQSQLDMVNGQMEGDQFDNNGYAYLFKPGMYNLDVKVGFYTHLIGLGHSPDDVTITGAVRSKADWGGFNGNATCNFWRTAENFAVVPTPAIDNGTDVWAVSQGTSMRRAHIKGNIILEDGGWSSGGFIVDSTIDGTINSGSQQQFFTRNDNLGKWQGGGWNMVFVGDQQAPMESWPQPPRTVIPATPLVREKPFLFIDDTGNYLVMLPALKTASSGSSWAGGMPPGYPLSIDRFYIAKPTDTASTINAALAQGKQLILTPGDYQLDSPIQVTLPNTVVFGMGLPVLTPTGGNGVLSVADVDGVSVSGLLVEAGTTTTKTLVEIGPSGSSADHSKNPTFFFDVHCRIGGNIAGTASSCFTVNSNDVVIDNSWLWRADHGNGADWNTNKSDSGLIVNGNDVTVYGLFVEHHQKYQTLWNGNGGSVYFYQSELPYDPPSQADWMSTPTEKGYPSYKVADGVTTHHGFGLGVYSFFQNGSVFADNAIETPTAAGIVMTHMMTFGSGNGGINNIINGMGGPATSYSSN